MRVRQVQSPGERSSDEMVMMMVIVMIMVMMTMVMVMMTMTMMIMIIMRVHQVERESPWRVGE